MNVQALNILQSEQKMYMGYLLPTITILREKLVSKGTSVTITKPLITSLIEGIDNRFATMLDDRDAIAAAIIHPKFKSSWTENQSIIDMGIQHIKQLLVLRQNDLSSAISQQSQSPESKISSSSIIL